MIKMKTKIKPRSVCWQRAKAQQTVTVKCREEGENENSSTILNILYSQCSQYSVCMKISKVKIKKQNKMKKSKKAKNKK